MSNLESILGMLYVTCTHIHVCAHEHEHIQEPRLSTTGEQFGVNLFASVLSNTSSGKGRHTFCTENRDLVPKKWVPWDFQSSTSSSTTSRVGSRAVSDTVGHSTSAPNLGPELISMFSTPGIYRLLQHITENSDCAECVCNPHEKHDIVTKAELRLCHNHLLFILKEPMRQQLLTFL